jgi:hypothetical protein
MFPYQLVCEGKADEVFFSRLLKASGKDVEVRCPKRDDPNGGLGRTAIHKTLSALQAQFDKITRVIVVVDSDDDPNSSFEGACGEFIKANQRNPAKPYPVPVIANTLAGGMPSTAVVLVPTMGTQGCLDSLLLPSFEQRFGTHLNCVTDFCTCMTDPQRGLTKDLKLRLRIIIASAFPKKPGVSLANLLEEGHCPIELTHPSFHQIRTTLLELLP